MLDLRGPLDYAHQRVIATGADRHFARLPVPFGDDGRPARRPRQNPGFVAADRPWADRIDAVRVPESPLTGEGIGAFLPPGRPCPPERSGQA